MKAISIKQPWAWLIVNGYKDIENRNWRTKYRGRVLIHASLNMDREMMHLLHMWSMGMTDPTGFLAGEPRLKEMACRFANDMELAVGGVVGAADIVDCVDKSESPWFQGKYGFVMADAERLPFAACKGKLGFFDVKT